MVVIPDVTGNVLYCFGWGFIVLLWHPLTFITTKETLNRSIVPTVSLSTKGFASSDKHRAFPGTQDLYIDFLDPSEIKTPLGLLRDL